LSVQIVLEKQQSSTTFKFLKKNAWTLPKITYTNL
jgi:hypothetical protein